MVSKQNVCKRCGSDCVVTCGPGRVTQISGATVRVPEAMELRRCHGCSTDYPTQEQLELLLEVADKDWLGDGGRSGRPVHRGS